MSISEIWTTLKLLTWTQEYLASKGVENSRREAEWLLCAATGMDRVGLYLNFEKPLVADELNAFKAMVIRRGKREPLQHILGSQEFYGLEFEVSPDVLIPRHDTEVLIDEVMRRSAGVTSILDVGTGSGCIAVTLAHELPGVRVTAVDISEPALVMAQRNAERNRVTIEFIHGSLLDAVSGRTFDLIVSNPPYIPTVDIATLQPEVRDHDPRIALDGGLDGLEIYATLVPEALNHLNHHGFLVLEIGIGQSVQLESIFKQAGEYSDMFEVIDGSGIIRVVGAQRI